MEKIGNISKEILIYYNIETLSSDIYVHQGTFKHINKRHPDILNPKEIIKKAE